jgi:molybdopterin molybdotransferase
MIPVEEAQDRITAGLEAVAPEVVAVSRAAGRVLAQDVIARRTQPPVDVSAMDGYAVRADDVTKPGTKLTVVGEAPAGGAHDGMVGAGEAVRIFTGGPVPKGANAVILQEDVDVLPDGQIAAREAAARGRHIRPAGNDFKEGDVGLRKGEPLSPRDVALAASMNVPWLTVHRKPRLAILATGDELVLPGETIGPNQIVSSNAIGLAAMIEQNGGLAIDLGIAKDNADSLKRMVAGAVGADLLITIGGASVGDHDLVRSVLGEEGLKIDFWKIAMRPGKPLLFGRIGDVPMIGLPGNPVSALVCALVFVIPALHKLSGRTVNRRPFLNARLGHELPENDRRQEYRRASLERNPDGQLVATPFDKQDSSVLMGFTAADCLIVRKPFAAAAKAGETVPIIPLEFGQIQV